MSLHIEVNLSTLVLSVVNFHIVTVNQPKALKFNRQPSELQPHWGPLVLIIRSEESDSRRPEHLIPSGLVIRLFALICYTKTNYKASLSRFKMDKKTSKRPVDF